MVLGLFLLDLLESVDTLSDLSVGNSLGEDFFHVVLLLLLSLLRVSSSLPLFNVLPSDCQLQGMDARSDVSQLLENRHHHELDEPGLSASDVGGCSIAHHGDVKALGLFHIALVEEFVEQQVSPLGAQVKRSEGSTDIASVQSNA